MPPAVEADGMTTEFDAVFWDIGGVILQMESVFEGHQRFVAQLVENHETPLSTAEALSTWRSELSAYFAETEGTNYRPAREGYRRGVDEILTADADSVDWLSTLEATHDAVAEPNPNAVETVQALAATPVHLGVISDADHEEGRRILDGLGVLDLFDAVTTSGEVGRKKPDPAIFETALEKAGVDPADAVMIGDRYSHDMKGGRQAGMTTVAYGASDGPAVDHTIEDLAEVRSIVGLDE
jgi:putative hydrolase of the HAD superfamily